MSDEAGDRGGDGEGESDGDEDGRRFDAARRHHEAILADPASVPAGWVEQARFRDRYDLPPFRPPRFEDGTHVRDAVAELESRFDARIEFVRRESEWVVETDDEGAFRVERRRDAATNVVVGMSAREFRSAVEQRLSAEDRASVDG